MLKLIIIMRRSFGKSRAVMGSVIASIAAAWAVIWSGYAHAYDFQPAVNTGKVWKVYKDHWDANDEAGYSAFVQAIGRSKCASLNSCIKDKANPYRSPDDPELYGDCADMAYTLRAYYAWKNGLTFSFQNGMRTADRSGQDLRYSTNGNVVSSRRAIRNITSDAHGFLKSMPGQVSTAMFRTHPQSGGGRSHDDFYPITITRDSVRPGIIAYDIFGHVGIVYDILDDGRVLIIAAHPDQSVTRSAYGSNFLRSKPALGAGLKAWRPIRVDGAQTNEDGSLQGGRLVSTANEDLPNFSLEQYVGTEPDPNGVWHVGEFRHQGRTLSYFDFVRRRLAAPSFQYNPIDELRFGLETLCGSLRARKLAVDSAVTAKVHLKPHPKRLPPNIFGTYGEWEAYSTPSRDARLKVGFIELRRDIAKLVTDVETGAPGVTYAGDDLAGDLINTFNEVDKACRFTYWRSDNSRVRLHLSHAMTRLFDLSFDPYHCPERRWGARGVELETCTDGPVKERWYNALRFLRYQAERTYDTKMDFTVDELKPPMIASAKDGGLGVEAPADSNIKAYLYSLKQDTVLAETQINGGPTIRISEQTTPERTTSSLVVFPAWHERRAKALQRKIANTTR